MKLMKAGLILLHIIVGIGALAGGYAGMAEFFVGLIQAAMGMSILSKPRKIPCR